MAWVIGFGLAALLAGGLVSGVFSMLFAPHREPSSTGEVTALAGITIAALVGAVLLSRLAPWAWIFPLVLWFLVFASIRNGAPLKETDQQRRAREAAQRRQAEQDEKRAAARKAVAERKHVDSLGKDGVALLERGRAAIGAVTATEAARDGWLGEAADLDFSADLATISDTLLQARRIEKIVARTKKIPDPSPDDITMLRDAGKTVRTLRAESVNRVKILEDCARQAREVDRLLAEERQQRALDAQREDARCRLAAELYGAEAIPVRRDSHAADAVAARVAAFRELKNVVDDSVRREITRAAEGGGTNPVQSAVSWVRRALPF